VRRAERVLVAALLVSRTGCFAVLALQLVQARHHDDYRTVLALAAVATASGLALLAASQRRGRVAGGWVAADWAVNGGLLVAGTHHGFYSYVLLATLALGLPRWPVRRVLPAGAVLAGLTGWTEWTAPARYPLWNIVSDSLAVLGMAGLVWLIVTQLRLTAAEIDRARAAALARTQELARDREHSRQARALRQRVLATLHTLAERDAVAEPAMRAQLAAETVWLERFVDGVAGRPAGLLTALREVVHGRPGSDLLVRLDDAEAAELPPLAPETVEAVAGAVWEALTNVIKHAGVRAATVRVAPAAGGLVVEVRDGGRGFDPAATPTGAGLTGSIRQRMADAGGAATIRSAPGAGTTVHLTLPLAAADNPAGGPAGGAGAGP
jgi:signal transduction histidine kinase